MSSLIGTFHLPDGKHYTLLIDGITYGTADDLEVSETTTSVILNLSGYDGPHPPKDDDFGQIQAEALVATLSPMFEIAQALNRECLDRGLSFEAAEEITSGFIKSHILADLPKGISL